MCIRVRFAPRAEIDDPWDQPRQVITVPAELTTTTLFTLRAIRTVLCELGIEQDHFGARCWCGEQINLLLPCIPQQRRSEEVIHLGA